MVWFVNCLCLVVIGLLRFWLNSVVLAVFYYMILCLCWLSCLLTLLFDCDVVFWFARVAGLAVLLLICGCGVLLFCLLIVLVCCVGGIVRGAGGLVGLERFWVCSRGFFGLFWFGSLGSWNCLRLLCCGSGICLLCVRCVSLRLV